MIFAVKMTDHQLIVNFLNIRTPKKLVVPVITLKFGLWLYHRVPVISQNDADGMANSVDPDQEQSDLGLHCLLKHICPKT